VLMTIPHSGLELTLQPKCVPVIASNSLFDYIQYAHIVHAESMLISDSDRL